MKVLQNGGINFYAPNPICANRASTLFSKEPETISWISGFPSGSVLVDVGANVGCYSLYAASLGHRVIAVEPSPGTFSVLCQNIILNDFGELITAVCGVVSDFDGEMIIQPNGPGEARIELGVGCLTVPAFALDTLSDQMTVPSHVKIDTDGHELEVLIGGSETLFEVESVIVETGHNDSDYEREISERLQCAGLFFASRHTCPLVRSEKVGMDHYYRTQRPSV